MTSLPYSLAADVVVAIHFGWILFLIGGAFIGRRVRWVMWTHVAALGYSILLQFFSWICPLTYLEFWLRRRSSSSRHYSGSFIVHYMERWVYMEIPRSLLLVLTGIVIGISAVVYYKTTPKKK
ncbi:MAG: DUF2784 domain-containing protein [Nitrospirae bacterium]|nr:DUF2784 domain-containing protein [Nitrospirota bacterium]